MTEHIAIAILLFFVAVLTIVYVRGIKRAIIERDELHRWHSYWEQTRRWLAEFPDAADALEHLKASATGAGGTDVRDVREAMRTRRDVPAYTPEERQAAEDFGIWIGEPTTGTTFTGSAITSKRMPL